MNEKFRKTIPLNYKGKKLGEFDICESADADYPGIDIEFLAEGEQDSLSRPRVVIEYSEDDGLRVLIWGDKNDEDYTEDIIFK